jgi:hypothetical protein
MNVIDTNGLYWQIYKMFWYIVYSVDDHQGNVNDINQFYRQIYKKF